MSARREIEAVYPLSPQQQGMLLRSLQDDRNALFVEQEVHTLHGPLDVEAFKGGWQDLLDRHSMLRTAFTWRTRSEPLQVVFRSVPVPLEVHDWRLQNGAEQKHRLEEYLGRERLRGFDFSRPPLMRLALLRTSEQTYDLVWTQHHLLYDGWCRAVLFRELTAFYTARSSGGTPTLPEAALYGSYIEWLGRQDPAAARRYWRRHLEGVRGATPLGRTTGFETSSSALLGHQEQNLRCPVEEMVALDRFAQQNRVTAGVVMQGLWAVLLSRYASRSDIVLGVTVSGRPPDLPGVESIVGPFMNTLPVRVHVEGTLDFCGFLKELQAHNTELRQFEYCSSAQIHEWTGIPGAVPLFDHILVYENYPGAVQAAGAGETSVSAPEHRFVGARTAYSLALLVVPGADLALRAVFDPSRLSAPDVRRVLEHIAMLLRHVVTQPGVRLGDLWQLVSDFEVPRYRSASGAVSQRAAQTSYVAPATAIERKVAAIAAEVLGLPQVSITGRFLELGGHSLLATQFVSRVSAVFAMEIPLSRVFDTPDLREFAAAVEQDIARKVDSLSEEEAVRMLEAMGQLE